MDIQAVIFGTIGGLAIFLFGMNYMSDGLKSIGSETFKRILQSITKNRATCITVGLGITFLIQSSSATSVMVVGFVNAGLLAFEQAIAVVLGADIGTTVTAWLVSTMGISKFKIAVYALPVIAIGFLVHFISKSRKKKMIGQTLLGFGLLFLGLGIMSDGVSSIKESETIKDVFQEFGQNPFLGILAGMIITMIIQSSSASIAIVQVMALQGLFGLDAALALMFGADIGTTITAQLAAIGGTKGARGVAMSNSLFKILGVILFIPLLVTGWYAAFIQNMFDGIMVQIAAAHTVYIVFNVLLFSTALWPLLFRGAKWLARIDRVSGKEKKRYLDPLLLNTPPIALEQCVKSVAHMTSQCQINIEAAFSAFIDKDMKRAPDVESREDEIDRLQSEVTSYLVQLSRVDLSVDEARAIPRLIHCINDAERIGDHAENLLELTELMVDGKLCLSLEARRDLLNYYSLVADQFKAVLAAFETKSHEAVEQTFTLEKRINNDYDVMTQNHVERLENGVCTVQTGVIFLDMIANLEKIGDHLTNIAERVDLNNS